MSNKSISLILILTACGGLATGEYPSDAGSDAQTGSVTQELITQVSTTSESECASATGMMYEDSPFAGLTYTASTCMQGALTVYVPRTRSVTIKTTNPGGYCGATQYSAMVDRVDAVIAELNTAASLGGVGGWTFSRTANGTHTVQCADIPTSPLGGNSIRNYVRVKPDFNGPFIAQGDSVFDGAGVYGWNNLTIQIDAPAVYAKGATTAEDGFILMHAVGTGILRLTGTGEYAGNRMAMSDHQINGVAGRVMFSLGERCRARNFSTTQPASLFWSTSAGCANN